MNSDTSSRLTVQFAIERKDTVGGTYKRVFVLDISNSDRVIQAPGTWRVTRIPNGVTASVIRD